MTQEFRYKRIDKCRICKSPNLKTIINLGKHGLTGIFPKTKDEKIIIGPLEIVKCVGRKKQLSCGLLQLRHSYSSKILYGKNYGYRSSLNKSMVTHLKNIVNNALEFVQPLKGDLVIDIGSNDGTLLKFYSQKNILKVGIDPTASYFIEYYPKNVQVLPRVFSSKIVKKNFGSKRARIITSIAMFYDLENPIDFAKQVYEVLDDNGVWISEQSYLPLMLKMNAYDTICHEHLEYYSLRQLKWIMDKSGFKIIDIQLNDINGGSIKLTAAKPSFQRNECSKLVAKILKAENAARINSLKTYIRFKKRIKKHRRRLKVLLDQLKRKNKIVLGYGASTKGNVILQYCGLTAKDIPFVAEVNKDKFGAFTPCSNIPIISEREARKLKPDYFFVLPWHFRKNFLIREKEFLNSGGHLIFPLPKIEII